MTDPSPPPSHDDDDLTPLFTPVPMQRVRHDGWTHERQIAFIRVLGVTGQVATACRTIGISRKSAYALRDRQGAESFAQAWEFALANGRRRMLTEMMERAVNGVTTITLKAGGAVEIGHGLDGRLMAGFLKSPLPGGHQFGGDSGRKGDIR